jgi:hypothetical protein
MIQFIATEGSTAIIPLGVGCLFAEKHNDAHVLIQLTETVSPAVCRDMSKCIRNSAKRFSLEYTVTEDGRLGGELKSALESLCISSHSVIQQQEFIVTWTHADVYQDPRPQNDKALQLKDEFKVALNADKLSIYVSESGSVIALDISDHVFFPPVRQRHIRPGKHKHHASKQGNSVKNERIGHRSTRPATIIIACSSLKFKPEHHDVVTCVYNTWLKNNNYEMKFEVMQGYADILINGMDSHPGHPGQLQALMLDELGYDFVGSGVKLFITWNYR